MLEHERHSILCSDGRGKEQAKAGGGGRGTEQVKACGKGRGQVVKGRGGRGEGGDEEGSSERCGHLYAPYSCNS